MGKCYTCVRYLMFTFNLIFLILGMAILGIGIWLRVDENLPKYLNMSEEQTGGLHTLAYVVIVIGSIIMITSFMGCCGAIIENQCMLVIFFILLLIVALAFLALGVVGISGLDFVNKLEDGMTQAMEEDIQGYFMEDERQARVDFIQNQIQCCGASKGRSDYPIDKVMLVEPCRKYTEPCVERMMGTLNSVVTGFVAVVFITAIVAILGMIFSMILCCAIRKRA